jgi:aspartate kinase
LIRSRQIASDLEAVFYQHLAEIRTLVKGIAILRELTPRSLDAICSYRGRLSSRIIAAGLNEEDKGGEKAKGAGPVPLVLI